MCKHLGWISRLGSNVYVTWRSSNSIFQLSFKNVAFQMRLSKLQLCMFHLLYFGPKSLDLKMYGAKNVPFYLMLCYRCFVSLFFAVLTGWTNNTNSYSEGTYNHIPVQIWLLYPVLSMKKELSKWCYKVFILFENFHRCHKLSYKGPKNCSWYIRETFLNVVSDSKLAAA